MRKVSTAHIPSGDTTALVLLRAIGHPAHSSVHIAPRLAMRRPPHRDTALEAVKETVAACLVCCAAHASCTSGMSNAMQPSLMHPDLHTAPRFTFAARHRVFFNTWSTQASASVALAKHPRVSYLFHTTTKLPATSPPQNLFRQLTSFS